MELKSYQKKVIKDLVRYLELMNETKNYAVAFRQFWYEVSVPSLGKYQDIMPGVPNLCFKVVAKPLWPAMPSVLSLMHFLLQKQKPLSGSSLLTLF